MVEIRHHKVAKIDFTSKDPTNLDHCFFQRVNKNTIFKKIRGLTTSSILDHLQKMAISAKTTGIAYPSASTLKAQDRDAISQLIHIYLNTTFDLVSLLD